MLGTILMRSLFADNPVARREARLRFWRTWSRDRKIALVLAASASIALLAYAARGTMGLADYGTREGLMLVYCLWLAVVPALIGARSVAGEREVRTWEQVLISRLRPVHLVVGKIAGILWRMALLVIVTAPALWICVLYVDRARMPWVRTAWATTFQPQINVWQLLFSPPGFAGGYGGGVDVGLFWIFTTAMLWIVQGASIGVFASLRYRSTITCAIVAIILLAIAIGLDLTFLFAGGFRFVAEPSAAEALMLALLSAGIAWGWPLLTIAVVVGLAVYEFREFDQWIQAGSAASRG